METVSPLPRVIWSTGFNTLQFGHDVTAVETRGRDPPLADDQRASIRPRRNRRGDEAEGFESEQGVHKLQFGHDVTAVETRVARCGSYRYKWLQFGHDVTAVETLLGRGLAAMC